MGGYFVSQEMFLELVGYFASLLVLVSLLMTSVVKLRVINMVGSLIFAIYALCIGSLPTAVMNFCLVGVNIFYLVRMARTEQFFNLLPAEPDSLYFKHFLDFHRAEIQSYFPGFEGEAGQAGRSYFVYVNTVPAGLLMGKDLGDGELEVLLDYAVPQYRDCSVGRYLYGRLPGEGVRRLTAQASSPAHENYLRKMGFTPQGDRYVKTLS